MMGKTEDFDFNSELMHFVLWLATPHTMSQMEKKSNRLLKKIRAHGAKKVAEELEIIQTLKTKYLTT